LRTECYTPETLDLINTDNWNFKAPNGESNREVGERMMVFNQKWGQNPEDTINAIFTHGVAIKCLLRSIYEWNPQMTYLTDVDNTSLTVIKKSENHKWQIQRTNDFAHLTLL
jgi:broad specificity phosphatase PhoE